MGRRRRPGQGRAACAKQLANGSGSRPADARDPEDSRAGGRGRLAWASAVGAVPEPKAVARAGAVPCGAMRGRKRPAIRGRRNSSLGGGAEVGRAHRRVEAGVGRGGSAGDGSTRRRARRVEGAGRGDGARKRACAGRRVREQPDAGRVLARTHAGAGIGQDARGGGRAWSWRRPSGRGAWGRADAAESSGGGGAGLEAETTRCSGSLSRPRSWRCTELERGRTEARTHARTGRSQSRPDARARASIGGGGRRLGASGSRPLGRTRGAVAERRTRSRTQVSRVTRATITSSPGVDAEHARMQPAAASPTHANRGARARAQEGVGEEAGHGRRPLRMCGGCARADADGGVVEVLEHEAEDERG